MFILQILFVLPFGKKTISFSNGSEKSYITFKFPFHFAAIFANLGLNCELNLINSDFAIFFSTQG